MTYNYIDNQQVQQPSRFCGIDDLVGNVWSTVQVQVISFAKFSSFSDGFSSSSLHFLLCLVSVIVLFCFCFVFFCFVFFSSFLAVLQHEVCFFLIAILFFCFKYKRQFCFSTKKMWFITFQHFKKKDARGLGLVFFVSKFKGSKRNTHIKQATDLFNNKLQDNHLIIAISSKN